MRPIKFRAYDKEKKIMVHDQDQSVGEIYNLQIGSYIPLTVRKIGEFYETYMQFTGLYDCKENPIYENDIVKYPTGFKKLVEFKDGAFNIHGCYGNEEIIGNQFENPELLDTK